MTDTDSRELDRPAMSSKSVDAAAGTARAQLTYRHLVPADPGHPLVDGGFWGAFTRSLESSWEQIKRDHAERTNTFDSDDADGQTRLVTDGGEARGREAKHRSGKWLGQLEGLKVREPAADADGAIVEFHGGENMAATQIDSDELVDELSHMAAEVQLVLGEVEDE